MDLLNLSKDAIHIHIGLTIFFVSVILWQKGNIKSICLIPVLFAAGLMEVIDLYDDINSLGHMRLAASAHDIINTCIWPTLIVLFSKVVHRVNNL
jgi:hypothetical protein